MTEANDRWMASEIKRLDGRIDDSKDATAKALAALGTGAERSAAARALAFSIVAASVSLIGLALAVMSLVRAH